MLKLALMVVGKKNYAGLGMFRIFQRLIKSIWLFPLILFLLMCGLAAFKLSGTSIGSYRQILYGSQAKDPSLVLGQPEAIRSDEWLVETQMTIAQSKAHFPLINQNIGHGQNMSVMSDVPYKEWSEVFRPQNLIYFVLPLENAFAFHWWLMSFLLVISCYFFVLVLLPKKKWLAIYLSLALLFSAFVQWWYTYGTLGSIYYPLFIATVAILLCQEKTRWKKAALSSLLAYLAACFALILYPPFQIPCSLVLIAFLTGHLIKNYNIWGKTVFLKNLLWLAASGLVAICIFAIFSLTRIDVIKSIQHTAYPGARSLRSGGINIDHLLASHLGHQFISPVIASHYLIDNVQPSNQSETSNFLLVLPFIFLPALILNLYEYRRRKQFDWPLLFLNLLFAIFILELLAPPFTTISKLLLLNKVGGGRLLIGVGLLNIMMLVVFIKNLSTKKYDFNKWLVLAYCAFIFLVELSIGLHAHYRFIGFVSLSHALALSIVIPVVMYLLLTKRFMPAVLIYLAFSLYIAVGVNPLYRGLGPVTSDQLSTAIRNTEPGSNKVWITDGGYLENMAIINNRPSLTGVYEYPQFNLWNKIPNADSRIYNRYAHVGIQVSEDSSSATTLDLVSQDSFVVKTNVCSDFLKQSNVGYLVSSASLKSPCVTMIKKITYPAVTLYIYKFSWS